MFSKLVLLHCLAVTWASRLDVTGLRSQPRCANVMLFGPPSVGKTALAIRIAENVYREEPKVTIGGAHGIRQVDF